MDWNHQDYIALVAAVGTVVAAVAAAIAAGLSFKSAKESKEFQIQAARISLEKQLYDLLQSDAIRANDIVRGIQSHDWTFNQVANITYAIESARKRILAMMPPLDDDQILRFKSFFNEQLSHEIKTEMKNMTGPPDALYKSGENWRDSPDLVNIFEENKDFFGYDYVRDSDLED